MSEETLNNEIEALFASAEIGPPRAYTVIKTGDPEPDDEAIYVYRLYGVTGAPDEEIAMGSSLLDLIKADWPNAKRFRLIWRRKVTREMEQDFETDGKVLRLSCRLVGIPL